MRNKHQLVGPITLSLDGQSFSQKNPSGPLLSYEKPLTIEYVRGTGTLGRRFDSYFYIAAIPISTSISSGKPISPTQLLRYFSSQPNFPVQYLLSLTKIN